MRRPLDPGWTEIQAPAPFSFAMSIINNNKKDADDAAYTLGGVRTGARDKGLYIIGGKKLIK